MEIEIHVTETEFLSEAITQTPCYQFKTENKNKKMLDLDFSPT